MAHPRQDVELYTVYNFPTEGQPVFSPDPLRHCSAPEYHRKLKK